MQLAVRLSVCLSVCMYVRLSVHLTVCLYVRVCVSVPATIERSEETEYQVMEDHNVMLRCRASGVPQPSVSWTKDGRPVTDRDIRYRLLRSGWLAIAVVR